MHHALRWKLGSDCNSSGLLADTAVELAGKLALTMANGGELDTETLARIDAAARRRGEELATPDALAAAMVDRLIHHAELISLKGDSYRLKDRDLGPRPPNIET